MVVFWQKTEAPCNGCFVEASVTLPVTLKLPCAKENNGNQISNNR
jgi:hypothetical protein